MSTSCLFNVFVINRAGSLIYDYDNVHNRVEVEKTLGYPLDLKLEAIDNRIVVVFGERDGIKVGHAVLSINGANVSGIRTAAGEPILQFLGNQSNYPASVKFGKVPLASNEKIILSSMFHSLYAIGSQLSPEPGSSGIQVMETDTFRLECFQTVSGCKFVVVAKPKQANLDQFLRKLYELYSDFALKNPFYSLEQPIRSDLFDTGLQELIEKFEKSGTVAV